MAVQILTITAVFFISLGVCFLGRAVYAAAVARPRGGGGVRIYTVIEAEGDAVPLEQCVRAAALAGERMLPVPGGEIYILDKGMSPEARRAAEILEKSQNRLHVIQG